jgi:DNA polymerase (family X)
MTSGASSEPHDCTRSGGLGRLSKRSFPPRWKSARRRKRFELSVAEAEAEALVGFLRNGGRVVVAGSYRRRRDTVGDLDVVVTTVDGATVGDKLVGYENAAQVLAHAPTRATVVLRSGLQVDVRAVPEQSSGAALLYFTGSKAHNIALRGYSRSSRLEAQRIWLVFRQAAPCRPYRGGNL